MTEVLITYRLGHAGPQYGVLGTPEDAARMADMWDECGCCLPMAARKKSWTAVTEDGEAIWHDGQGWTQAAVASLSK